MVGRSRWFLRYNAYNSVFATTAASSRLPPPAFFRTKNSHEPPAVDSSTYYSSAISQVSGANPLIGKHTLPATYNTFVELQTVGNAFFPSSEDDPASNLPTDIPRIMMELNASVVEGPKPSSHHPSMLVDMENGRPMEIEHIIGELVRMAHECGVSVPVGGHVVGTSRVVIDS